MRCRDVVACWDDMRCGEEPRRQHVLEHLRTCPECQAVYAEFEGVAYCLSCLPVVLPPHSLVPRIMAHIKQQSELLRGRAAPMIGSLTSPIGPLYVGYRETGVVFVFVDRGEGLTGATAALARRLRAQAALPERELPAWVRQAFEAFFTGTSGAEAPLDLADLTEFERTVLRAAAKIPSGEVRSYGWLAREIGRPTAARAVGHVLANNPVPLLIPCHRVIDGKGRLHNYRYGIEMKRRLLEMEGYREEETPAVLRTS